MELAYQQETFRLESEHWWYRARRKIILSQMRKRLSQRENRRILDVGCGAGTILSHLDQFGEATGLDTSPAAVEFAKQELACDVRVGSMPNGLPDGIGEFDAVCFFDVIEHLDDDVAALQGAAQILRDHGTCFVTVPAQPWLFGIHDEINEHRRRYTKRTLRNALRSAGFEDIYLSYFNFLLSPALVPAIMWRNYRRDGHHFEVRSAVDPILEAVFSLERHLIHLTPLPFGLSLFAAARR